MYHLVIACLRQGACSFGPYSYQRRPTRGTWVTQEEGMTEESLAAEGAVAQSASIESRRRQSTARDSNSISRLSMTHQVEVVIIG